MVFQNSTKMDLKKKIVAIICLLILFVILLFKSCEAGIDLVLDNLL